MPQQSSAELAKKYGGTSVSDIAAQFGGKPVDEPPQPEAPRRKDPRAVVGDAVSGVVGGAWDVLNPLTMVQGLAQAVSHPIDTAVNIMSPLKRLANVPEAYQRGVAGRNNIGGVAGGLLAAGDEVAASIPLLGPAAEHASQRMKSGDTYGGIGEVVGLVGGAVAPEMMLAKGKTALSNVRKAMQNPNVTEAAALKYVADKGVPVDAGTMSGNAFVKGATQNVFDKSIGGSVVASKAEAAQAKGLSTIGEQLAAKAHSKPATALSAGEDIKASLAKQVADLHSVANTEYSALRALEQANKQKVIVGQRASASGLIRSMPITEEMGFPVQLKNVKDALRPLYDKLQRQMPVTQQQASAGLKALDNIINGPDIAPASLVDADLSAIKTIARGADSPELRNVSQGIAAAAVRELDAAVRKGISNGGPKALAALDEGRKATAKKYLVAEISDDLRKEPVKAFNQTTARHDTGIAQLRELASVAPAEIPKIGRAWLDDKLQAATATNGFDGAQGLFRDWQNLGGETKKMLYGHTPGLVDELDKFFLAAKKLAENKNPSGTGAQNAITGQIGGGGVAAGLALGGVVWPMAMFTMGQGAAYALSKAMRSPATLRILTQGMNAKPNSVTYAMGRQAFQRLLAEAGKEKQ